MSEISSIFNESISSRSAISSVFDERIQNATITLDFKDICFVSRSAAQQLELEKVALKKRNVDLVMVNTSESIEKMFLLAEDKSQRLEKLDITIKTFSTEIERREFMLSF